MLDKNALPQFDQLTVVGSLPDISEKIQQNREFLNKLLASVDIPSWDNLIAPLEEHEDQLSRLFSPISHLNSVKNERDAREGFQQCLAELSAYHTEVGQNHQLYQYYQMIADSDQFANLSQAQQMTIEQALRDFRLSGVTLDADKQQQYQEIQQQLSQLSSQFENHVLDATAHWVYHTDDVDMLSGLPGSVIAAAEQKAAAKKQTGYCLGIDAPTYMAVVTYADNRELREQFYQAYCTRASDQGPDAGRWDNSDLIKQMVSLRHQLAKLLDFAHYADCSLATKMAQSSDQVIEFLEDLARQAKPLAVKELETLKAFAEEQGCVELSAWDMAYYSEKLSQQQFDINQEKLRDYFPVERVLNGLFGLIEQVFGITVTMRTDIAVWHPDVRFIELSDQQKQLRGGIYIDLYAREHKRGGAWMDDCQTRFKMSSGQLQYPVAYLNANFMPPPPNQVACLTHDDVVTLFHEFGHCLHHVLTQVDVPSVAGIHGVPWDGVELPSQFMENFCWADEVLPMISAHINTGDSLPRQTLSQLQSSRTFQAGMQLLRQIEFSLFDFYLHRDYNPQHPQKVDTLLADIRQRIAVVKPPAYNRFAQAFSHIFAGGYAAGYYSYKWAEVLSADAFARFKQEGVLNQQTGQAFLQTIFECGGSEDLLTLFKKFRGREPQVEALLADLA